MVELDGEGGGVGAGEGRDEVRQRPRRPPKGQPARQRVRGRAEVVRGATGGLTAGQAQRGGEGRGGRRPRPGVDRGQHAVQQRVAPLGRAVGRRPRLAEPHAAAGRRAAERIEPGVQVAARAQRAD